MLKATQFILKFTQIRAASQGGGGFNYQRMLHVETPPLKLAQNFSSFPATADGNLDNSKKKDKLYLKNNNKIYSQPTTPTRS